MNFDIARNTRPLTNAANAAVNMMTKNSNVVGGGVFNKFWAVMVLILVVFVAMVIYYKTIGYYLEIGWNRIYAMITGRTDVSAEIGGESGLSADLKPMDAPPQPNLPAVDARPPGMPGATDGTPLFSSLSIGGPKKEVFNVSRNIYTYNDAAAVCQALGAELANYEQVQEAYNKGADWCNYGWTKGQLALFPTQKETWEKLQKGPAEYRNACGGRPGVNGGYFDNPELRFGVNCIGVKPPRNATDELLESQVALPPTPDQIEFDKKVQKYREQMNTITVLPFQKGQWTE
jgi:hypothetical protein